MLSDLIRMSLQGFKKRRLRSWLTMIGIFIGIAAVVSLISLGEGLEKVIISQFSIANADVISISPKTIVPGAPGEGAVVPITIDDLKAVRRVSEVEFAEARILAAGMIEFNKIADLRYIGSFSGNPQMYELANIEVSKGRLLKAEDRNKIMVGSSFADPENSFGKEIRIGSKVLINGKSFQVVGILKRKGSFVLDSTIIMNEDQVIELFDKKKDEYNIIAAKIKKNVDMDEAKEKIEKALLRERNVKEGEEDFTVQTNESALEQLESTLFGVKLFVYIIAGISIIVGGIGIMNTMYTSVLERRKDIGIMKAIGAKNKDIFWLFFIESGLLGTAGGIIGIILGVSLAEGFSYAGRIVLNSPLISSHITIGLLIGSLLFSFIIGTISGLFPALQASKMNPVDALRK